MGWGRVWLGFILGLWAGRGGAGQPSRKKSVLKGSWVETCKPAPGYTCWGGDTNWKCLREHREIETKV